MNSEEETPAAFKFHARCGWKFYSRPSDDSAESQHRIEPASNVPDGPDEGEDELISICALGLGRDTTKLWGPQRENWAKSQLWAGKEPPHDNDSLQLVIAAVSAARIACLVLQHLRWCKAALTLIEENLPKVWQPSEDVGPVGGEVSSSKPTVGHVHALMEALSSTTAAVAELLEDCALERDSRESVADIDCMDPETVVYCIANLDSMYHALVNYHLTAPWPSPPVPPPHAYFAAHVALIQPEAERAVARLMERAAPHGQAAFCRAWDLQDGFSFQGSVDPLRQVMWARWREGAVLLFARGLGDNGEIDDSAASAAQFMEWADQERCAHSSGPPENAPVDMQEVDNALEVALGLESTHSTAGTQKSKHEDEFGRPCIDGIRPPPPAYPALQAWRDSARAWACHLYAFAAPNELALQTLAGLAPLVEVGAGLGYWAWLLRQRGVEVLAFDAIPCPYWSAPGGESGGAGAGCGSVGYAAIDAVEAQLDCASLSAGGGGKRDAHPGTAVPAGSQGCVEGFNEYHGEAPSWSPVQHGRAGTVKLPESSTLFLCYAAPNNDMAVSALSHFKGSRVALVGEWDGDTATPAFARLLFSQWQLEQTVSLPNWSDTAHDLTIWARRPAGAIVSAQQGAAWPQCCVTGIPMSKSLERFGRGLKRCCLARDLCYASKEDWEAGKMQAMQHLALRFVLPHRCLDWESGDDFEVMML